MRITLEITVPKELALSRLDQAAATLFPQYSRSRLQGWIRSGELTVNDAVVRPREKLFGGERLVIDAEVEALEDQPEAIDITVLYADNDVIVIDKPAGLVVHPGAGNPSGTLLNGLLAAYPELQSVPRAGIVHRLDKETSGLLVVARTLEAQNTLVSQLQEHSVRRIYEAIVYGTPPPEGEVDAPISRHPVSRQKMAVMEGGKEAVTGYRVLNRFADLTHMEFSLQTGRTHQIRVHMQHLGYPLVGDPVYGGLQRAKQGSHLPLRVREFPRQALHARRLSFLHPADGRQVSFSSPLPDDLAVLLDDLLSGANDD